LFEFGFAAGEVDILDPEQENTAVAPRRLGREQRRIGMPQMKVAGGRGGEARNRSVC